METMPEFKLISGRFVAICDGLDIAQPLDDEMHRSIVEVLDQHGVCIFRNTNLISEQDQLSFARQFGPLMHQRMQQTVSARGIRLTTDELIDVGNLDGEGNIHATDDPRLAFHKGNSL